MQQLSYSIPPNGIETFLNASESFDLEPVGLGSMQNQAKKLAEYGRNGDIYVVHAAEGETVVPMEVLEANPKVKELLFNQMKDMGLDPQEFVVGDDLNSINPVTGMPEFFFKKIFRGVKKAVKKVVKVAKKIAPIALPLIAATFGFPFLGAAFKAGTFGASALAGGISTLAQGGSFKDALKSGLISGGIASLTGGLKGLGQDGGFMGGLERSFTGAGAPSWSTQWDRLKGGQLGDFMMAKQDPNVVTVDSSFDVFDDWGEFTPSADQVKSAYPPWQNPDVVSNIPSASSAYPPNVQTQLAELNANRANMSTGQYLAERGQIIAGKQTPAADLVAQNKATQTAFLNKGDIKKGYDWFLPKDASAEALDQKAAALIKENPTLYGGKGGIDRAVAAAKTALNPSVVEKYWKPAGTLLGAAYLGGAFDVDRPPGISDEEWEEMQKKMRNKYWFPPRKPGETDAEFEERKRQLRAPYAIPERALNPYLFAPQGGAVQNFDAGGAVGSPNLIWTPEKGADEAQDVYDKRLAAQRAKYAVTGSALDPYHFLPSLRPAPPPGGTTPPPGGTTPPPGGTTPPPGGTTPPSWVSNLHQGLRYTDGRLEIDPAYAAARPQGRDTWGWEEFDRDGDIYDRFNPQSYLQHYYENLRRNQISPIGGGYDIQKYETEQDDSGNPIYEYRITGPNMMAGGGMAQYPRREMLVEGPGTERSDDIPAMLSDGEFVLNAKSVRGADPTGQGNRYRGAQNLYKMMRNFEMRA
jgi:hypothetical protein